MINSANGFSIQEQVLYEDNYLIVVNKLPGQLVQPDKKGDRSLQDYLAGYISDKRGGRAIKPGIIHRIDRPASGIVMFAAEAIALAKMNLMLTQGQIQKTYWAVVDKKPVEKKNHLIHYIYNNPKINKSFVTLNQEEGGLKAELKYEVKAESDHYMLLEIDLITGRRHQIRAQLASAGIPVKGDIKYGSRRTNREGLIHLHAREVRFKHPVSGNMILVTAPPPADRLWDYFAQELGNEISEDRMQKLQGESNVKSKIPEAN